MVLRHSAVNNGAQRVALTRKSLAIEDYLSKFLSIASENVRRSWHGCMPIAGYLD